MCALPLDVDGALPIIARHGAVAWSRIPNLSTALLSPPPMLCRLFDCRGREVKKSGGGGRNWGNDAAAGMDNAAATAENDGDGPAGNWGANGAAPEVGASSVLYMYCRCR